MARINIEDSIYKDRRFIRLCVAMDGDIEKALGAMVRAWTLAQEWFLKTPDRMIPLSDWASHEINPLIVEVGLAKVVNDRVHICGADEQFSWLLQRSNAGKTNREIKRKSRQRPTSADESRRRETSSSSFSSSFSFSNSNNNTNTKVALAPEFELLYQSYPLKKGKSRGLKRCEKDIKTAKDLELLSRAILNYSTECLNNKTKPEFIKHFSTFMGEWRDWIDFTPTPNSGVKGSVKMPEVTSAY